MLFSVYAMREILQMWLGILRNEHAGLDIFERLVHQSAVINSSENSKKIICTILNSHPATTILKTRLNFLKIAILTSGSR